MHTEHQTPFAVVRAHPFSRVTLSLSRQIVALDSQPVRDSRQADLLIHRHYEHLFRYFAGAQFIFIPENNLGLESSHLHTMVGDMRHRGVRTYFEKKDRPGVCKDGAATREYQFLLDMALSTQSISFDSRLFTVTPDATDQLMRDMLREQMLRFHWESVQVGDRIRTKLTAKMGSKQDDLLVAVMMLLHWGRMAMKNLRVENALQ